jgi:hypothetical protein
MKKRLKNKTMECGEDQLIEIEIMGCAAAVYRRDALVYSVHIIDSRLGLVYFDTHMQDEMVSRYA